MLKDLNLRQNIEFYSNVFTEDEVQSIARRIEGTHKLFEVSGQKVFALYNWSTKEVVGWWIGIIRELQLEEIAHAPLWDALNTIAAAEQKAYDERFCGEPD